jgi:hypothetical protein
MTGNEDQPQQVVANIVIEGVVEGPNGGCLLVFELVSQLGVFALEKLLAAEQIDGAMLGGRHQPRAGVAGHAFARPLLERGDERVVREILGRLEIAGNPRQGGDQAGRLDAPDGIDRSMGVGLGHDLPIRPSSPDGRKAPRAMTRTSAVNTADAHTPSLGQSRMKCLPSATSALLTYVEADGDPAAR